MPQILQGQFKSIHHSILTSIQKKQRKNGLTGTKKEKYLLGMYFWNDNLTEELEKLGRSVYGARTISDMLEKRLGKEKIEEDSSLQEIISRTISRNIDENGSIKDYINVCYATGFCEVDPELQEVKLRNSESDIKVRLQFIPPDETKRNKAKIYIKNSFAQFRIPISVDDVIADGIVGIENYIFFLETKSSDAAEAAKKLAQDAKEYLDKEIKAKSDPLDVLLDMLIYAQTGDAELIMETPDVPKPNVFVARKKEIESGIEAYSLDRRAANSDEIILINYASTSVITSRLVSRTYNPAWLRMFRGLRSGKTEIHMVLTAPDSPAAQDAVNYKMKPETLKVKAEDIIKLNVEMLKRDVIVENLEENIHLYFTKIALPCAFMLCKNKKKPQMNTIKVDLYMPIINDYEYIKERSEYRLKDPKKCDENKRLSFVVYNDGDQKELYQELEKDILDILSEAEEQEF